MSWRSCSPSWPYPPAAPVWGCPGGERGRTEKPHIRGIRLGTILLLRSKEWGVNVVHSGHEKEKKLKRDTDLSWIRGWCFFSLRQKVTMCVRHSHLYWCYLENLSLNPSTSPVNWCRGWWSFAAYFLLHWRREKEPKSKHRFCPCVKLNPPASPPLLLPPLRAAFAPTSIQQRDNYRNGERRHLSLSSFPSHCWCSLVLGCCCMRRRMTSALAALQKINPFWKKKQQPKKLLNLKTILIAFYPKQGFPPSTI